MGKGFNNYMCKKFFHPASRDNLKRVWMAEQKTESYKKKQDELRIQYEKEQELYNNKAMLSKESKDKLSVNFMYEPPPGTKKEREREDNEAEVKFEWQRKFNAPREDYCKGDTEIRDQPFGIPVRNVRCIKCHKWGHINTDKECPMYNQSSTSQLLNSADPMTLIQQMREDGLTIKRSVLEAQQHLEVPLANNKDLVSSGEEDGENITQTEKQFLKSLSKKQKMKLLRKLEKLEKKKKLASRKSKKEKKRKKKSKKVSSSSDSSSTSESSSSDDTDSEDEKRKRKEKRKKQEEKSNRKNHKSNGVTKTRKSKDDSSQEELVKKSKKRKIIDKEDRHATKKKKTSSRS